MVAAIVLTKLTSNSTSGFEKEYIMKPKFNKHRALLLAGLVCFSSVSSAGLEVSSLVKDIKSTVEPGSLGASQLVNTVNSLVGLNNEVIIQGAEVSVLIDVINTLGGVITHELPLINGIGVRVSDAQLVLLNQLTDIITIKKNEAVYTSSALDHCLVYGSHVAELTNRSIRWNLYNARDMEANMQSMSFKWPEELGHIYSVKVNGATVYWRLYSKQTGELSIDIKRLKRFAKLDSFEGVTVEVSFANKGVQSYQQRDFSLDVQFKEGCDRSLVKGYDIYGRSLEVKTS